MALLYETRLFHSCGNTTAASEESVMWFEAHISRESGISRFLRSIQTLCEAVANQIVARLRRSDLPTFQDEAIEILTRPDSDPDERDWAERYLCGMSGADRSGFIERRRCSLSEIGDTSSAHAIISRASLPAPAFKRSLAGKAAKPCLEEQRCFWHPLPCSTLVSRGGGKSGKSRGFATEIS